MRSISHTLIVVGIVLAASGCSTPEAPQGLGQWEALPLGTRADFRDVWFTDSQHGWIVGGSYQIDGGLIGRTQDGGHTWRFTSDILGTSAGQISVPAVRFFDAQRGIVATSRGPILSTTDGGENWAVVNRLTRSDAVSNFFFLDEQSGWAVGLSGLFRTDDAGRQWSPVSADETGSHLAGRAVSFVDDRVGWIAGMHALLMRTADGGVTWESSAIPLPAGERPSFWDVCFVEGQFGWVVGEEGTILATTDGGMTWTLQSTGVKDAHSAPKLERIPRAGKIDVIDAGDRTPGLTLRAVRFVDRRRGWVVGHYANLGRSLILRTEDGGATWAVDADIAGEELNALFVQDREQLWAIGSRVREGAQAIYRRPLSAAGAVAK